MGAGPQLVPEGRHLRVSRLFGNDGCGGRFPVPRSLSHVARGRGVGPGAVGRQAPMVPVSPGHSAGRAIERHGLREPVVVPACLTSWFRSPRTGSPECSSPCVVARPPMPTPSPENCSRSPRSPANGCRSPDDGAAHRTGAAQGNRDRRRTDPAHGVVRSGRVPDQDTAPRLTDTRRYHAGRSDARPCRVFLGRGLAGRGAFCWIGWRASPRRLAQAGRGWHNCGSWRRGKSAAAGTALHYSS